MRKCTRYVHMDLFACLSVMHVHSTHAQVGRDTLSPLSILGCHHCFFLFFPRDSGTLYVWKLRALKAVSLAHAGTTPSKITLKCSNSFNQSLSPQQTIMFPMFKTLWSFKILGNKPALHYSWPVSSVGLQPAFQWCLHQVLLCHGVGQILRWQQWQTDFH